MVSQLQRRKRETETVSFRFTPEDRKILAALKQHLGVQSMTDIMRMGIRTLAHKEGISQGEIKA